MPFDFKITLVVPVYNKERRLEECLESIIEQTIDKRDLEVILVNDGSADTSSEICRRFSDQYDFIRTIEKENGGVSSARNAGILAARGKYIAFLDADDAISQSALESLVSVFAKYEEAADLLTYRLVYRKKGNVETEHKRYKWLTATGLYDLAEYPYICQTTMNVVIKNNPGNPILFDESMKMGEDQHFVTRSLSAKAKVAYCAEATYYYVKDGANLSAAGNNPLFSFDDMIKLFEFFEEMARSNPKISEYARQMILYNIAWRLRHTRLFPHHCQGATYDAQEGRLARIVSGLPVESLCRSPYLDKYHKPFLLKHFNMLGDDYGVELCAKKSQLSFPLLNYTWRTLAPSIDVISFKEETDGLHAVARFCCPLFLLDDRIKLEWRIDKGAWVPLALKDSAFDYWRSKEKTAKFFSMSFFVPSKEAKRGCTVSFRATDSLGNSIKPVVAYKLKRSNARHNDDELVFADYRAVAGKGSITVCHRGAKERLSELFSDLFKPGDAGSLRHRLGKRLKQHRGKTVWIYIDLPTDPAANNALLQLLHDIGEHDDVCRYYVTADCQKVAHDYPKIANALIEYNSDEHRALTLCASVILVSYREKVFFHPFTPEEWEEVADCARGAKIVYLQHGILHAKLPWYLGYDRTLFDFFVTSTSTEDKVLASRYAYPQEALLDTGAPRFDLIDLKVKKEKRIAFIPSWRGYLVGGNAIGCEPLDAKFLNSSVWQGLQSFLSEVERCGVLERLGYTLDLKLHPNFKIYEKHLKLGSPRINLIDEIPEIGIYRVAVTDFSSYVYDFLYAGARVMYYVPDATEIRAGLNQYREFEIPLQDAFGPYSEDAKQAVDQLKLILEGLEQGAIDPYRGES